MLDIGVFLADGVERQPDGLSLSGLVWCRQKIGGPDILGRLERRQRVGLYRLPDGDMLMELAVVVPSHGGEWANAKRLPLGEMGDLVGGTVQDLLEPKGVSEVATRAALFGDSGRRRNAVAGRISGDPVAAAVWAYCLTRVVPLLRSLDAGS